jgi:hypothetical protein
MSDSSKKSGPSGMAIAIVIGLLMVVAISIRKCDGGSHGGPPPGTPGGPPAAASAPAAHASSTAATTASQPAAPTCLNASETVMRSCIFNADGSSGFNTELAGDTICTNLLAGAGQLFSIQDLEGGAWKPALTTNASMSADDVNKLEAAAKPVSAFRFVGNQGAAPVTIQYWAVKQGQSCGAGPSSD